MMLQIMFLVSLESSCWQGVHGLRSMMFILVAQIYFFNIEWIFHWKLNCSWKILRNGNVLLVLENSWWAEFNGVYLVRFGFKMLEILIFKWFLPIKIQNKLQNSRFWKEKSVENVVTLALPFNSSMISFHIWLFKKLMHTLQKNVHMLNFRIL